MNLAILGSILRFAFRHRATLLQLAALGFIVWASNGLIQHGRSLEASEQEFNDLQKDADLRNAMDKVERARLEAISERDRLARKLEDQINADPIRVPICIDADGVRGLNAIR